MAVVLLAVVDSGGMRTYYFVAPEKLPKIPSNFSAHKMFLTFELLEFVNENTHTLRRVKFYQHITRTKMADNMNMP